MDLKTMRYNLMLALYFPILAYAFSTFDVEESKFAGDVRPVVVANQQTVLLGQPFEARAYLVAEEDANTPIQIEGYEDLALEGDSLLTMPTASLLGEGENQREVAYAGRLSYKAIGEEYVDQEFKGTFTVRRPEVIVRSEATQALYRQSLNELRFEVPGLETAQIKLETGGRVVEGRTLALSPAGSQVSVDVLLGNEGGEDILLGSKSFQVIDPPRPELRVTSSGRPLSSGDPIPLGRAVIEFEIEPDAEFQQRFPQDARYTTGRVRVVLGQGLTRTVEVGTFSVSGNRIVLTQALDDANARSGDRIQVQLEGVYRINHAGQTIPVGLNEGSRSFVFTLS